ncbi:kinase-like domain-containing protein [Baffinella frigidus]|nr:kinase-like domain-containing protein [Cryptophyta sp. CCMP2293]
MHNAVDSRPGAAGEGADAYEKLRELGVSKQIGLGGQPNGRGQAPSSDRQARISRAEREACLQEVRLMQSISHNHVIKFEASFVDEQSVVIIMEYASGGTVADLIKERRELHARFEEEDIWRCLLQVGLGLDAIHERGVIHRDIKAANILVDGEGDFKIGDLGIAVPS